MRPCKIRRFSAPGEPMNLFSILSIALQSGGVSQDLSFLAYLDVWIIGGLVILAVVVVVGKWIWGRLHRQESEEDYWDYYHDDEYVDEYILDDDPSDRRD